MVATSSSAQVVAVTVVSGGWRWDPGPTHRVVEYPLDRGWQGRGVRRSNAARERDADGYD
jgi:hypothetical protein